MSIADALLTDAVILIFPKLKENIDADTDKSLVTSVESPAIEIVRLPVVFVSHWHDKNTI